VTSLCTPAYRQAGLCNSYTIKTQRKPQKTQSDTLRSTERSRSVEMMKVKIAPQKKELP